jgi:hypothetical protein
MKLMCQPHEHGRRSCPPPRLVREPYRQHCQQCPAEGKCQQDHTGEDILIRVDERGGDQRQGDNESSGQRCGDY